VLRSINIKFVITECTIWVATTHI